LCLFNFNLITNFFGALDDEKLYYGFALDNCHEIEPLKTPKKTVKDFDKKLYSAKEKQQAKHNEYFELLKPFLYTGKKNEKNHHLTK
jgi:hypothetical protein